MQQKNPILSKLEVIKPLQVFIILWAVTFALYVYTREAGWVIDGMGFLYNMRHHNFWDFINTRYSADQGFYQLYALHYYIFYNLWGMSTWMWGLLYMTLHALNATLIFSIFKAILTDSRIGNSGVISLVTAAVFTFSPHISEVLVWRACFHYLLSFLFILSIIQLTQKYQHNQTTKYTVWSAVIFVLAAMTNPIFYLAPIFVLTLALYYHLALGYDKHILHKTVTRILVPQLILFACYFIALYAEYGTIRPHKTELNETILSYLSKPGKYLFHIITLGRYFPVHLKDGIYDFFQSLPAIIIFYLLVGGYFIHGIARLRTLTPTGKAAYLFALWSMTTLLFLAPLAFPMSALWVFFDRYIYFTAPFIYLTLTLFIAAMIKNKYLLIGLFCAYIDVNLYFTIKVNTSWTEGDKIDKKLVHDFPNDENKTVLLLNNPENMNGAAMIGAQAESHLKNTIGVYTGKVPPNNIYDVASYNMVAVYNGAHVKVLNDSMISVVLNHTGTWWWYEGHGALSYETPEYKVDVKKVGQRYDLTLKHPANKYLLLYTVGDAWKKVDMSKLNVQQD